MLTSKLSLICLILVLCLLETVRSVNWQGMGNFTKDNVTLIWKAINDNSPTYITATHDYSGFVTKLSDTYNGLWDQAWNVFLFKLYDATFDAIMVGYAFRDHWFWFNNHNIDGSPYSFIIWKDYNCKTWNDFSPASYTKTIGDSDPNKILYNMFTSASAAVEYTVGPYPYDDIWDTTWRIHDKLEMDYSGIAFTLLAVQNGDGSVDLRSPIYGRFCSSGGSESFLGTYKGNLLSIYGRQDCSIVIITIQAARSSEGS